MLQSVRLIGMVTSFPHLLGNGYAYFRLKVQDDNSENEYRVVVHGNEVLKRVVLLTRGCFAAVEGRLVWGANETEPQLLIRAKAFRELNNEEYRQVMGGAAKQGAYV